MLMDYIKPASTEAGRELALERAARKLAESRFPYDYPVEGDSAANEGPDLLHYWQLVRRRKVLLLVAGLVGLVGGVLMSALQTPVYEAKATVEFQGFNDNLLNTRQVDPTPANRQDSEVNTQVDVLKSKMLRERVVSRLVLEKKIRSYDQSPRVSMWRKLLGLPQVAKNAAVEDFPGDLVQSLEVTGHGLSR